MKIKICGIKNLEEARWAIASGADFLGFNFYPPSPRAISVEDCCRITKVLRHESPHTLLVGVFVNHPPLEIRRILDRCHLDLAQLSGDESLEDQKVLGERAYKVLRLPKALKRSPSRSKFIAAKLRQLCWWMPQYAENTAGRDSRPIGNWLRRLLWLDRSFWRAA